MTTATFEFGRADCVSLIGQALLSSLQIDDGMTDAYVSPDLSEDEAMGMARMGSAILSLLAEDETLSEEARLVILHLTAAAGHQALLLSG